MSKRMDWRRVGWETKMREHAHGRAKEIIAVPIDALFWKAWQDDPKAMREAGYRVRKVGGRWQAWIER
jgi:hypothetical protein